MKLIEVAREIRYGVETLCSSAIGFKGQYCCKAVYKKYLTANAPTELMTIV